MNNIHGSGPEQQQKLNSTERKQIIDWLAPINFFLRHTDISRARQAETGGWLLAHPLFKQWESDSGGTLWCSGIPGGGKTVLASLIVDHLTAESRNTDIGVACIYLNHKEADSQTPVNLMAGLWRQLILGRDVHLAEQLFQRHSENFGTAQVCHCRVSSLPKLEILEIHANDDDLRKYVHAQIQISPRLSKHVQKRPELREEIDAKISGRTVDGMFLLAKLHIESLSTKNTIKAIRDALNSLPKDLYDSYNIAMQRIEAQNEEDRNTAHSALMWVANAKRPLKVSEITAALAIEPGAKRFDEDNVLEIEIILAVCAGLVIVDQQISVVRLVHYTTQEYLDSIQANLFPDAQTEITRTLLTFVTFDDFPDLSWIGLRPSDLPPLLEYSQYCLVHAAGQPEGQLQAMIQEFLRRVSQWWKTAVTIWHTAPWNFAVWPSEPSALWIAAAANLLQAAKFLLQETPLPDSEESDSPAITVASYYGHLQMVRLLVENGADVNANAEGGPYGSALQAAVYLGNTNMVQLLLKKGADANRPHGKYDPPLTAASYRGYTNIVQLLLENGADVNAQGGGYGCALQAALSYGQENIAHLNIARLLIGKGANVNAKGGLSGSPLHAAVSKGSAPMVQLLVENNADVNMQVLKHGTALTEASYLGYENLVRLLIDKGADPNALGGEFGTALGTASWRGYENIVRLLLLNGANVNAYPEGRQYHSALYLASNEKIAQLLIDNGADVNLEVKLHGTVLIRAAYLGYETIVLLLISKGADLNVLGQEYGTALAAASLAGHENIVQSLLENGAGVNIEGGRYHSALYAAVSRGHKRIARLLIEKGANVNTKGGLSGSPLYAAVFKGSASMIQLLIENSADVNMQDPEHGTALVMASGRGRKKTVRLLLLNGADVNTQGGDFGTALGTASWYGHENIVQSLLENGACVNILDGRYGSALYAAASNGHQRIVQLLIENGADVSMPNKFHETALAAAADHGHKNLVQLLLDTGAGLDMLALRAAAKRGHLNIVRMFLENEAYANRDYRSAIKAASQNKHKEILRLLIGGANVQHISTPHVPQSIQTLRGNGAIQVSRPKRRNRYRCISFSIANTNTIFRESKGRIVTDLEEGYFTDIE
ncbi:ankyrin repeat-containing domain protein [Mycena capillaripes]|nr:ankyrin repeat-containing domain protein [Mycena capillaripes]